MTPREFLGIYAELADQNPFAVRAVLKVLRVEFTDEVPTLAVTLEAQPRMLVNLGFVAANCQSEAHVKAVICHEFLHVLLRHTERFRRLTPAQHLALDAVINAIIHRELGAEYSAMMSGYYAAAQGIYRLLRPGTTAEYWDYRRQYPLLAQEPVLVAWRGLYEGRLVADDIMELAQDFEASLADAPPQLLGSHDDDDRGEAGKGGEPRPLPDALQEAIGRALKAMNGDGIWRSPQDRGIGGTAFESQFAGVNVELERWRRETFEVLKRCLVPDPRAARSEPEPYHYGLPVLSSGDRRAVLRAQWSPLLPEALWRAERLGRPASAQVYLDVSGSMYAEMPLIVTLLARLSRYIRRPFWAFSNVVAPARIAGGQLQAQTTGGTSMACVLEHVAQTRPSAAVVVTDGYIERLPRRLVRAAGRTRLHALVTRDGSPALLHEAGIPCAQLGRLPT